MDILAWAFNQAESSDYQSDMVVLNPTDFWSMAITKDSQGRYLFSDPSATTIPRAWGRPNRGATLQKPCPRFVPPRTGIVSWFVS